MAQELELCRAHLRVMSPRTGKTWQPGAGKLDPAALVPPALFLTLIENGFSHQRVAPPRRVVHPAPGEGAAGGHLTTPSCRQARRRRTRRRAPGGTGLRYVRARLEESFPGRWSFRDGLTAAGWETVIEVRDTA